MRRALASGDWVDAARIRSYSLLLLLTTLAFVTYLLVTAPNALNDAFGRPLGTDFSNVYAAGLLVREGVPAMAYDPATHYAREQAVFGPDTQFYGWHYPPYFLLLAAALAALPYALALLVWQGAGLAAYLAVMRGILPQRLALLAALAFPAVLVNLGHGHNGFLSAALLGGALWLLPTRPWLAGVLIGLLVYKPQLGLLIPLALLAGRQWRAFVSASATVLLLSALVTWLWGAAVWEGFFASLEFTRRVVLEEGQTGFHKMMTLFAWVRLWGGGTRLAYAAQGLGLLACVVAVVQLWRRPVAMEYKAAGLILASLLSTPYAMDYDLMLLAPAIAFWVRGGLRDGFLPYEKTVLALAFAAPLVARSVAGVAMIPLGLWVMLALSALLLRRVMR